MTSDYIINRLTEEFVKLAAPNRKTLAAFKKVVNAEFKNQLVIRWCWEDVRSALDGRCNRAPGKRKCLEILRTADSDQDAEQGVCWDTFVNIYVS